MSEDPTSLSHLHDILLPAPPALWPPQPGWWWILGFLLLAALTGLALSAVHWQRNRYRREALAEWRRLAAARSGDSAVAALTELAVLLKRAAVSGFPRMRTASVTGPEWLAFLDRTAGMNGFSSDTGALLERAAYGSLAGAEPAAEQVHQARQLVHDWLARHKTGAYENRSAALTNSNPGKEAAPC